MPAPARDPKIHPEIVAGILFILIFTSSPLPSDGSQLARPRRHQIDVSFDASCRQLNSCSHRIQGAKLGGSGPRTPQLKPVVQRTLECPLEDPQTEGGLPFSESCLGSGYDGQGTTATISIVAMDRMVGLDHRSCVAVCCCHFCAQHRESGLQCQHCRRYEPLPRLLSHSPRYSPDVYNCCSGGCRLPRLQAHSVSETIENGNGSLDTVLWGSVKA